MWKIVAQTRVGLGLGRWLLGSEHFLQIQEERNLNLQHTHTPQKKMEEKKTVRQGHTHLKPSIVGSRNWWMSGACWLSA